MKFKATSTIILYHEGKMEVFNADDKGDLPEDVIRPYIDAKQAVVIKGKAAKNDPKPEPEGEGEGETESPDDDGADGDASDDGAPAVTDDAPPA